MKRIVKRFSDKELRELLHYDPETGIFRWIKPRARWMKSGDIAGGPAGKPHAWMIGVHGKRYYAHRLAWFYMTGEWPHGVIDHKNGDPLDNRFQNLRDVQRTANQQNMRRRPRGAKYDLPMGVSLVRGKYFTSTIKVNGDARYIGCFATAQEAHEAYCAAKRTYHDLPAGWCLQ